MTAEQPPWVCPWTICNREQAQACRAITTYKGCGGRFPGNMTPEQAREEARRPLPGQPAYGVAERCTTCGGAKVPLLPIYTGACTCGVSPTDAQTFPQQTLAE